FQLAAGGGAKDLVIPDHFTQGKRKILLRLVLDDLSDLGRIHGRQFYKLGKSVKARSADVDVFGLKTFFGDGLLQRLQNNFFAGGFLRAIRAERFDDESIDTQSSRLVDFKLRE